MNDFEQNNLVVVAKFIDLATAVSAQTKLNSESIESRIDNDIILRTPWLAPMVEGMQLLVKRCDFNTASRILNTASPGKNAEINKDDTISDKAIIPCPQYRTKNTQVNLVAQKEVAMTKKPLIPSVIILVYCSFLPIGTIILGLLLPEGLWMVPWLIIFVTSLWAAIDSSKINLYKYKPSIALNPILLFMGCALLWLYIFPWYMHIRYKIKHGLVQMSDIYRDKE